MLGIVGVNAAVQEDESARGGGGLGFEAGGEEADRQSRDQEDGKKNQAVGGT
jgi:hypothetical protein